MSPTDQGKLSKEEVEALLHATLEEDAPAGRPEPTRRVQGYDFLQPSRFNRAALERLRRVNEKLAQQASLWASKLLRTNVKTQLASMDQMKWEHLLEEAATSVAAFLVTLEPLGHRGIIWLDMNFAASCLERMLGGKAEGEAEQVGDFSEVDVAVLERFLAGFLQPLPELWERIGQFEVEIGRFVTDLKSLDLFSSSEDFFQMCFLVQTSVGSGQVVISVPFEAVRALPPEADEGLHALEADQTTQQAMRESIKDVDVELTVQLGRADIKVARLVSAGPGDVIVLDCRIGEPLKIKVNDKVKLRGFPGLGHGKYGVRILLED